MRNKKRPVPIVDGEVQYDPYTVIEELFYPCGWITDEIAIGKHPDAEDEDNHINSHCLIEIEGDMVMVTELYLPGHDDLYQNRPCYTPLSYFQNIADEWNVEAYQ